VFAVPDERLGEVPAAVIYSEHGKLEGEALLAFLGEHLAQFKLPAYVWNHDEPLPKLGTGKIDKVELRERYRRELAQAA
jgi:acyl-CoA synthetase (AMP-forming)/AMP-acid ligase II